MTDTGKALPAPGTRPRFTRPATAGEAAPQRKVRIDDDVWVPACERAANVDGRRISAVARDLFAYYAEHGMPS